MQKILNNIKNKLFKEEKDKLTFIAYWVMLLTYSIIGYVGDIDVLRIITFIETPQIEGSEISLIAILLPLLNSYLIWYLYDKWK